jgi:hypothetical protein
LDVAYVKASAAVNAGSSAHQLLQQNVISQGDIEDSVNWEDLEILIELSSSSGESIKNDSLSGLWFLDLLVDDFDDNFVTDQSTRLDDAANGLDQPFIETAGNGTLENFSDLVTS